MVTRRTQGAIRQLAVRRQGNTMLSLSLSHQWAFMKKSVSWVYLEDLRREHRHPSMSSIHHSWNFLCEGGEYGSCSVVSRGIPEEKKSGVFRDAAINSSYLLKRMVALDVGCFLEIRCLPCVYLLCKFIPLTFEMINI